MNKFKKIFSVILVVVLCLSFVACQKKAEESTTVPEQNENVTEYKGEKINIASTKSVTALAFNQLFESGKYNVSLAENEKELAKMLLEKKVDFISCSLELGKKLESENGAKILGIDNIGTLYITSKSSDVKNLSSLSGTIVYASGEGSATRKIFDYILEKNNLSDKIKVKYLESDEQVVSAFEKGDCDTALLSEPYASATINWGVEQKIDVNLAVSIYDEWMKVSDTRLAMGCIVTTKEKATDTDACNDFEKDVMDSVEHVNLNSALAVKTAIQNGIFDKNVNPVDKKALKQTEKIAKTISRCNVVYIYGDDMQKILDFNFSIL